MYKNLNANESRVINLMTTLGIPLNGCPCCTFGLGGHDIGDFLRGLEGLGLDLTKAEEVSQLCDNTNPEWFIKKVAELLPEAKTSTS